MNSKVFKVPQPFSSNEFYRTFQSASKCLVALFLLVFGDQNSFLKPQTLPEPLMKECNYDAILVSCQVSRCFRAWWFFSDNEIICGGSYKRKKRGRIMLSLPAKRVCEFMLLTWHIFLYYTYVSHLLPPLTLKLAFNRQNKPIFPWKQHAHSHLVLLPFFAGCCNCL